MRPSAAMLAAVGLIVGSAHVSASAADAQERGCERRDDRGKCIAEIPVPIGSDRPGGTGTGSVRRTGSGGRSAPLPPPPCPWVTVSRDAAEVRRIFPDAPPGAVLQVRDCADANPGNPGGTQLSLGMRWVPGGNAAPAPSAPAALAAVLYARVEAEMVAPRLVTNPPLGEPAVAGLPVFVEVANWRGEVRDGECQLLVCVEIVASPSLELDPGDGSPVVACDPPGSRFDPAASDAAAQAAVPGACAYTYRDLTGVRGRPEEWPGTVAVRWAVSWTSNTGASGSFPELVLSTPAPRAVDEVQTVVADRGG